MHIATEVLFSNTRTRALRSASIMHAHIHIGYRTSWMHFHGVSHSLERKACFLLPTTWESYSYLEQLSKCYLQSCLYAHQRSLKMVPRLQKKKLQSTLLLARVPRDASKSRIRFAQLDVCRSCSRTSGMASALNGWMYAHMNRIQRGLGECFRIQYGRRRDGWHTQQRYTQRNRRIGCARQSNPALYP